MHDVGAKRPVRLGQGRSRRCAAHQGCKPRQLSGSSRAVRVGQGRRRVPRPHPLLHSRTWWYHVHTPCAHTVCTHHVHTYGHIGYMTGSCNSARHSGHLHTQARPHSVDTEQEDAAGRHARGEADRGTTERGRRTHCRPARAARRGATAVARTCLLAPLACVWPRTAPERGGAARAEWSASPGLQGDGKQAERPAHHHLAAAAPPAVPRLAARPPQPWH